MNEIESLQEGDKMTKSSLALEKSKLGRLLNKLRKDELKSLHKFLRSPWFGTGEPVVRLYEKLVADPNYPNLVQPKAVLQRQLQLDTKALNKQMNALLVAVEKFLVHQALEQDERLAQKLLMRAAKSHQAHDLFNKQVGVLLHPTTPQPIGMSNDLHEQFLVEFEVNSSLYLHPNTDKFKPKVEALHQAICSLDRYYVSCKLFFACEVYNRRLVVGEEMEVAGLESLIELARQPLFNDVPIFQLYLAVLDRLRFGRDDVQFEAALKLLGKSMKLVGKTELQALMVFLINHANSIYKSGVKAYLTNILRLYVLAIRYRLVDTDGQLSPGTYVNISNTAVLCQKFNFAETFIVKAQEFLPKAEKKPTVHIAIAFLNFHKGDFREAYNHAYRSDLSSTRYALIAKPLILRSNFEELLGTGRPRILTILQANIEAFKKYISREGDLSPKARETYLQFARILQSMARAVSVGSISAKKRERLLKLLLYENPPFSRTWLQAKILDLP